MTDARPCKRCTAGVVSVKFACGGSDVIELVPACKPEHIRVVAECVGTHLKGKCAENAVAGVGESLLDGLISVMTRAGYGYALNIDFSVAGEGTLIKIVDVFNRRRKRNKLEYRAGGEA